MQSGRPRPARQAHVITATPSLTKAGTVVAIMTAIGATILGIIFSSAGGPSFLAATSRLLAVAMFAVALVSIILLIMIRSQQVAERLTGWRYPTLEFSQWPVELGSRVVVTYRREALSAKTLNKASQTSEIEAEIVCEEWVEYSVGTDTRTDSEDVVEIDLAQPVVVTPQGIEATFSFVVPVDRGGPSMDLPHNRIQWRIENELDGPFGKRTETRAAFPVVARLDVDAVVGEGPGPQAGDAR